MQRFIVGGLAVLVLAGLGAGALVAQAQPAPPPANPDFAPPGMGLGGPHPPWHGWMRGLPPHRPFAGPHPLALVYRHADRRLGPADVATIAQAFLLWNGNHSWKVVDVAPTADGAIGFAYATGQGAVVARFTMDPHTGRITRTG